MPQPAAVDEAAQRLLELFRGAQERINTEAAEIATDPTAARRRVRLRELGDMVDREMASLRNDAARWLSGELPDIYALGATDGAAGIGESWTWTQVDAQAVQQLANDVYADVLVATTHVAEDVKLWIREVGRRQTAAALIEGQTAQQAARELARMAAGQAAEALGGRVGMIRYADGSYRRLADYADTLVRTKSAEAYNHGTLNTMEQFGVEFLEVLDGSGCGWTSHDDGDKANGTVRPLDDCRQHPLSHPRCRRSFLGRPNIRNADQASRARPSTTAAQRADQAAAEQARDQQLAQRARARREREARAARQPRTPRAASGATA